MHSCVTSKNVKWCHLIWPTLYIHCSQFCVILLPAFVLVFAASSSKKLPRVYTSLSMSVGPTALEKMLLAHRCGLAGTAVTPWGEI